MKNKEEIAAQRRRLKQVIKRLRTTRDEFAARLGTTKGYVNQVLGGGNKISAGFREKLSKHYTQINVEWVMTGEGEMFLEKKEFSVGPEPGVLTGVMEGEAPAYERNRKIALEDLAGIIASLQAEVEALRVRVERLEGKEGKD